MFKWNFLCCILCPVPLVLSLGIAGEILVPLYYRKEVADFTAKVLLCTYAFPHCLLELCPLTLVATETSSRKHIPQWPWLWCYWSSTVSTAREKEDRGISHSVRLSRMTQMEVPLSDIAVFTLGNFIQIPPSRYQLSW